jgi:hypothetical protein
MEFNFFDTEVDLSTPIDTSQIKTETKDEEAGKEAQEGLQVKPDIEVVDNIDDVLPDTKAEGGENGDEKNEESAKQDIKAKTPSEQGVDSSSSPYSTYAKALFEEGVLTHFDEAEFEELVKEHGEAGALIELNKKTIADQIDNYKNSLTAEQRDVLEAIEKGVPLDKYIESKAAEQSYLTIKVEQLEEDEKLCKRLIADNLKSKGFDSEEIDEQIENLENLGKLEANAKKALTTLQASQKEAQVRMKAETEQRNKAIAKQQQEQLANLKKTIDAVTEIMPGVKINQQQKTKIYEAITQPTVQTENGQWLNAIWAKRAENPIDFDTTLGFLFTSGVFDKNWSKIMNTAKTGAVKDLESVLKAGSVAKTGDMGKMEPTKTSKEILGSMKVFAKKNY